MYLLGYEALSFSINLLSFTIYNALLLQFGMAYRHVYRKQTIGKGAAVKEAFLFDKESKEALSFCSTSRPGSFEQGYGVDHERYSQSFHIQQYLKYCMKVTVAITTTKGL
jgi:hypothetical protein